MYSCPACGAENVAGRAACVCGTDLTLLQRLDGLADAWFNQGLEALAQGAPWRALEWISACCAARPTDRAARRTQAKLWAQLGFPTGAADALERAASLDPQAPELAPLRRAFQGLKPADVAKASPAVNTHPKRQVPTRTERQGNRRRRRH